MYDTTITIRTNKATKKEAKEIFAEMGLDISTAINMFLKKAVKERAVPFRVSLDEPNEETKAVIREAMEHPETLEGPYTTIEEMLEALHA